MKRDRLNNMSVDQLISRFVEIALAQDDAILHGDIARFNRLFGQMDDVSCELKSRRGDQRHALMRLYQHDNMQVRLKAAIVTLAIKPEAARQMLEAIAASGWQPQAGDAGMTLLNLDRGIFTPT